MGEGFTDSLDRNYEILRDMLRQLPPQAQARARQAYNTIEGAMNSLRVNGGENDPAVTLGLAMAGYQIARALTQEGAGDGLIQLLS